MTKRNLLLPLAAAFATLPIVIGIAAWQFPLHAAPQEAVDDPAVEVQLGAGRFCIAPESLSRKRREPNTFPEPWSSDSR